MKAVVFKELGQQLHAVDLDAPQPADHEVLIAVHYAGVNPIDWKIGEGYLKKLIPYHFPVIPGWDAAGVVSAIGKSVTAFKEGDSVYTYCRKPTMQWGTYAEYVTVDQQHVALKPQTLTYAQAAGVPLAALTAWQALNDFANIGRGSTVLIHAGAGGVGSFAIQFAKLAGAQVTTTASLGNHPYVKELGADWAIDYQTQDFVAAIKTRYPRGVDLILDCVGGDTLKKSFSCVLPGGKVISIVNRDVGTLPQEKKAEFDFVFVAPNGEQLTKIAKLYDKGNLKPVALTEYPLAQAAAAHQQLKTNHTRGKVVLKI